MSKLPVILGEEDEKTITFTPGTELIIIIQEDQPQIPAKTALPESGQSREPKNACRLSTCSKGVQCRTDISSTFAPPESSTKRKRNRRSQSSEPSTSSSARQQYRGTPSSLERSTIKTNEFQPDYCSTPAKGGANQEHKIRKAQKSSAKRSAKKTPETGGSRKSSKFTAAADEGKSTRSVPDSTTKRTGVIKLDGIPEVDDSTTEIEPRKISASSKSSGQCEDSTVPARDRKTSARSEAPSEDSTALKQKDTTLVQPDDTKITTTAIRDSLELTDESQVPEPEQIEDTVTADAADTTYPVSDTFKGDADLSQPATPFNSNRPSTDLAQIPELDETGDIISPDFVATSTPESDKKSPPDAKSRDLTVSEAKPPGIIRLNSLDSSEIKLRSPPIVTRAIDAASIKDSTQILRNSIALSQRMDVKKCAALTQDRVKTCGSCTEENPEEVCMCTAFSNFSEFAIQCTCYVSDSAQQCEDSTALVPDSTIKTQDAITGADGQDNTTALVQTSAISTKDEEIDAELIQDDLVCTSAEHGDSPALVQDTTITGQDGGTTGGDFEDTTALIEEEPGWATKGEDDTALVQDSTVPAQDTATTTSADVEDATVLDPLAPRTSPVKLLVETREQSRVKILPVAQILCSEEEFVEEKLPDCARNQAVKVQHVPTEDSPTDGAETSCLVKICCSCPPGGYAGLNHVIPYDTSAENQEDFEAEEDEIEPESEEKSAKNPENSGVEGTETEPNSEEKIDDAALIIVDSTPDPDSARNEESKLDEESATFEDAGKPSPNWTSKCKCDRPDGAGTENSTVQADSASADKQENVLEAPERGDAKNSTAEDSASSADKEENDLQTTGTSDLASTSPINDNGTVVIVTDSTPEDSASVPQQLVDVTPAFQPSCKSSIFEKCKCDDDNKDSARPAAAAPSEPAADSTVQQSANGDDDKTDEFDKSEAQDDDGDVGLKTDDPSTSEGATASTIPTDAFTTDENTEGVDDKADNNLELLLKSNENSSEIPSSDVAGTSPEPHKPCCPCPKEDIAKLLVKDPDKSEDNPDADNLALNSPMIIMTPPLDSPKIKGAISMTGASTRSLYSENSFNKPEKYMHVDTPRPSSIMEKLHGFFPKKQKSPSISIISEKSVNMEGYDADDEATSGSKRASVVVEEEFTKTFVPSIFDKDK